MKRRFLTLAILFGLVSPAAFAQDFNIGIKAGADIHKISGKSFKDEFSFGYQLGGFAEIGLSKKWAIQPEVLFSQVNIDTTSSFKDVYQFDDISKVKLSYLKIPLLLNYKPNKFVALQVGPQFGILMDKNNTLLENGRNAFRQGDFSMLGGLQLNIAKVRIYGRYAVGLNNINDIDNQEKWKNQNIQVGLGLTL